MKKIHSTQYDRTQKGHLNKQYTKLGQKKKKYLRVQQESQLGPGLLTNIIVPGEICQATDMASFL
jgi:hypothetical protein